MINFDNIIQFLCPIKRGQANTLMLKSESISIDIDSYSISKSHDETSDSKNTITSLQKKYLTINEVVNYIYGNKLFEIKESVNSNSYKQKYASFRNHSKKKGIMHLYPHFDSLVFSNTSYILTVLNNVQSLIEILAPEHCCFENLEDFFCQTFLMYNTDVTMINNWKSLISDAEILTIMFLSCAISPSKDTEERFFNHSFLTSIFPNIKKIFYSESLINEEINKQCIALIGYTNINIIDKPLRLTQFNEALTNYLINVNDDKTLLCKIINDNTLRPMMLLPSKTPLPTNITYETYAGAFGDINELIELSLTYDYNINEYFFINAIKSYNNE